MAWQLDVAFITLLLQHVNVLCSLMGNGNMAALITTGDCNLMNLFDTEGWDHSPEIWI